MDTEVTYTTAELNAFRRLVVLGESRHKVDRIRSRLEIPDFIDKHGRPKCDAMFEILKKEVE